MSDYSEHLISQAGGDGPTPSRTFSQRIYRVQGERADGTTHTRDYLSRAKAATAADALAKLRTVDRDGAKVTLYPLSNVRITRSAPIRWLYETAKENQ